MALCMLGTDYEMQMCSWLDESFFAAEEVSSVAPGRCTAFAVTDAAVATTRSGQQIAGPLCGQNVDEDPRGWLEGQEDVIIRHLADPDGTPDALLYTHPGVPAYCGMNSAGLAVMNLFIDDGARCEAGVPIDVVLREVLVHRDIRDAVAYLERVPRMAATTYLLVQDRTIVAVETTAAPRTSTVWVRGGGEFCHSNHPILDQRMAAECGAPSASSSARLQRLREAVAAARGRLDVEEARHLLSCTPPAHDEWAPTIARVVMEPARGRLHVRFRGEDSWIVVGFADDDALGASSDANLAMAARLPAAAL